MLRVRKLSGEEVASIAVGEVSDVMSLKRRLSQLPGVPSRFRQKLLLDGRGLEDADELDSPMELQLVLLPFADVAGMQVQALVEAAERDAAAEVEAMLQLPQDPDVLDARGNTALVQASREGHVEVVALLLEGGADTGLAEDNLFNSFTALTAASQRGHLEVVRLLLEAGADKDLANRDGFTALLRAALEGNVDVVRLLLGADADKDLADMFGITALMYASAQGHDQVARLLLEAGAGKDLATRNGFTALMQAARHGHVEVVRLLLEAGAKQDLTDKKGKTALMAASAHRHVEVVRLLLEARANKDLVDEKGHTALKLARRASRRGCVEIVRLLSEADSSSVGGSKRRRRS